MFLIILQDDSADRDDAVAVLPSVPLTNVPLEASQQPRVQRFTRSTATSSSMPPPPPRVSERASPMESKKKGKGKEKGKGRKRKRDEDGEAGRHHLSAHSLVQQVIYNVIPI